MMHPQVCLCLGAHVLEPTDLESPNVMQARQAASFSVVTASCFISPRNYGEYLFDLLSRTVRGMGWL